MKRLFLYVIPTLILEVIVLMLGDLNGFLIFITSVLSTIIFMLPLCKEGVKE